MESGLTLDINRLLRQRGITPGKRISGSVVWNNTRSGERTASIGYEASLICPEAAWIRLHYTVSGTPKDYRVRLETTPCHYGGLRWWWRCPISGRRAAKLYLRPGETIFAARKTFWLAYRSQRWTMLDRSHARQTQLYGKLGGEYNYYQQPPPRRPKGMHRKTYERLQAELYAAIAAHEDFFRQR